MPLLNRLTSGRIYQDTFDSTTLNTIWQVSPTDPTRYNANTDKAGHLRMKHGDVPLYVLMDMPNREDFVFQIKTDYTPSTDGDTAGIIVYRDNEARMELLEYYDPAIGAANNWTDMRMIKKGEVYSGYGSVDGGTTWSLIGTGTAEAMGKIGLVVNFPNVTGSVPFDVDSVSVYKDNKVVIGNLTPGMTVEMLDASGFVVASTICEQDQASVYFDTTMLPMPFTGSFKVYQNSVLKDTSAQMEIWGGDTFWYGLIVEVYMDTAKLTTDTEKDLGHMINGLIEKQAIVKNPGTEPLVDVNVAKSSYFDYKGVEWVQFAEDVNGMPGTYQDSIALGTLNAAEEKKIWIKVKRQYSIEMSLMGKYKFLLEVTN